MHLPMHLPIAHNTGVDMAIDSIPFATVKRVSASNTKKKFFRSSKKFAIDSTESDSPLQAESVTEEMNGRVKQRNPEIIGHQGWRSEEDLCTISIYLREKDSTGDVAYYTFRAKSTEDASEWANLFENAVKKYNDRAEVLYLYGYASYIRLCVRARCLINIESLLLHAFALPLRM